MTEDRITAEDLEAELRAVVGDPDGSRTNIARGIKMGASGVAICF